MRDLDPRAWIPSLNRYATGFDGLYYHRQMNGEGEWWCCPAGEDEQLDVEIELPTGLKDKNGKEIYEGDIIREKWFDEDVRLGENRVGKVEYFTGGFVCWFVGGRLMQLGMLVGSHIEVIGNIHENKELLEIKDVD